MDKRIAMLVAVLVMAACGETTSPTWTADAGAEPDAGAVDDAGPTEPDLGRHRDPTCPNTTPDGRYLCARRPTCAIPGRECATATCLPCTRI